MLDFEDSLSRSISLMAQKVAVVTVVTVVTVVITTLLFSPEGLADDEDGSAPPAEEPGPKTSSSGQKKTKRTTVNFEDQLIEGRSNKPELFVLLQNRMNNSRRLFKLRENFLPEMRKTAEDAGRSGGEK